MTGTPEAERILDHFADLCDHTNPRWKTRSRLTFSVHMLNRAYSEVKRARGGKVSARARDEAETLARTMFDQRALPPTRWNEL